MKEGKREEGKVNREKKETGRRQGKGIEREKRGRGVEKSCI